MLNSDRIGVLEDGGGEGMAEHLVDSSLGTLKDEHTRLIFLALGICPEDVPIPLSCAQLICGANAEVAAKGKVNAILMRRSVKTLIDRNLLQGSITGGVWMHDIVRDLVRSRIGGEEGIRERQRSAVGAFVAACPDDGWAGDDAMGHYAAQALQQHMVEGISYRKAARR